MNAYFNLLIISKRALVYIFLNESICSVLWQYSHSPLIQAALYSFQYSQNAGFLPPLHLGKTDIGIWDLVLFKWLHVYSENLNGCFKPFKTSPLFHHMATSHFWRGMSLYGKDVYPVSADSRTYPSVATWHQSSPTMRPPTAGRRRGRAAEWRPRNRLHPRAEATSGSHTDLPFCHIRAARHQMRTRDRLVGPFCLRWMLRTVRRLRNMTIASRGWAEALIGGWSAFGSEQENRQK